MTIVFVVGTAIAIIAALPTGGGSVLAWVGFAGSAALTLFVSGTLYVATYNVTTKVVSDMLGDIYYLPMYEVTPYEIFADKVLLFDVNFFHPEDPDIDENRMQENSVEINFGNEMNTFLGKSGVYALHQDEYDQFKKTYGFADDRNISTKNTKKYKGVPDGSNNIMYEYEWTNSSNGKKYKVYYAYCGWLLGFGDEYCISNLREVTSNPVQTYSTASILQSTVATWYKSLRNIALVALLSVLVYIGIRITLSSVASDKAKYKQMLVDWVIALCLVFLMHYIMAFSMTIVEKITDMLASIQQEDETTQELKDKLEENNKELEKTDPDAAKEYREATQKFRDAVELFVITSRKSDGSEDTKVQNAYKTLVEDHNEDNNQYKTYFFTDETLKTNATDKAEAKVLVWPANNSMEQARMRLQLKGKDGKERVIKYGYAIIYIVLIIYTVIFSFTYLKRVIYMAFLTIIAPLVAITYPIDKMNDGKAQAFDMWLKEYIFNLLIQPLHLLLYIILIGSAMTFASKNIFYVVLALGFFVPAEKLLRRFFGFEKAQTPGMFAGAAGSALMMSGLDKLMHPRPPKNSLGPGKNNSKEEEDEEKKPLWRDKSDLISNLVGEEEDSINNIDIPEFRDNLTEEQKQRLNFAQTGKQEALDAMNEANTEGERKEYEKLANSFENDINNYRNPDFVRMNTPNISNASHIPNLSNSTISDRIRVSSPEQRKRKKSKRRAIGRASRAYGSGMKKKLQARYKAKGGMGRRTMRTVAGLYGATALAAAGGLVGITSGDLSKAAQYMAAGAAGGYALGKGAINSVADNLKVEGTFKEAEKGYYGDEYEEHERDAYKRSLMKNEENLRKIEDKLHVERKKAKKIMEENISHYVDEGIYDMDDLIATYRLEEEENMSRKQAIETAKFATQVMDGEDPRKMTSKKEKEHKDTFIPKFAQNGSKNPEADVDKVFDNVAKFHTFKS